MEDKKLDFNQPFLSVRRHLPMLKSEQRDERKTEISYPVVPWLPPYRSELKSGPISYPGSIPFIWEQTPGQPKEEAKPHIQNHDKPPTAPMLPPGRCSKPNQLECDTISPSNSGRKNSSIGESCNSDNKRETSDVYDEHVKNIESSKHTADMKLSSASEDSDNFVDALDSLSRAESSFINCSMNGFTGLDDLEVKQSRSRLIDLQSCEFMMDRFLPAAKAMASEAPHYARKRQPLVVEEPKLKNEAINKYKPTLRYGPSFAKRCSDYHDRQEVEESDDDNDQWEKLPGVCGLLPRFCFKGSLGRPNPVLGMSVRTRVSIPSSKKPLHGTSPSDSYSEPEDEQSRSDVTELKSIEKIQAAAFLKEKNKWRSNYFDAPLCFIEEKEARSKPEEHVDANIGNSGLHSLDLNTFGNLSTDRGSPKEADPGCSVVEKTLYVDTVQKLESPNLSSSLIPQDMKEARSSSEVDHKIVTEAQDQIPAFCSSTDDLKKMDNVDRKEKLLPHADKFDDSNIDLSADRSDGISRKEMAKASATIKTIEPGKVVESSEKLQQSYSDLLAPPPLPKSPSDSWLSRTLPSMSKSSSLHSCVGAAKNPQVHVLDGPVNDVKWEAMVKSTNSQHGHMHYTLGLLSTIPEA